MIDDKTCTNCGECVGSQIDDYIEELEAKQYAELEKAVEAAHQLASDATPCACHDCLEAHTILAELKGQEDE